MKGGNPGWVKKCGVPGGGSYLEVSTIHRGGASCVSEVIAGGHPGWVKTLMGRAHLRRVRTLRGLSRITI